MKQIDELLYPVCEYCTLNDIHFDLTFTQKENGYYSNFSKEYYLSKQKE